MSTYNLRFKRKQKGKTNYKKRMKLLVSKKPRLVVRKSLRNVTAQIVEYNEKGDKILLSANSRSLLKLGWKGHGGNLPSAYLVGLLLGSLAKKAKIKEVILDIGMNRSINGSRIYAVVKGVIEMGVEVPHSKEALPSDDRIKGVHIADYANKLGAGSKIFMQYNREGFDAKKIPDYVDELKKRVVLEAGK